MDKRINKFIVASTAAVYGDPEDFPVNENSKTNPVNVYGATKLEVDKYLEANSKNFGLSTICFRFFNVGGAFKTKDGIFSMVIKLTNAGLSVTPEDPNDKSKDQSRGWILALPVPGVAATTSGFDYGAGYYNVQTQVPYNQLAPFVEGDPSTSNLDTRTWTDKVMDS